MKGLAGSRRLGESTRKEQGLNSKFEIGPVQSPFTIEFDAVYVINLNAAKALALTVPQSLLIQANDVIE